MPAKSKRQQRFMGAELARRREGKQPRIPSLTTAEVEKFAHTKRKGLPARARKKG